MNNNNIVSIDEGPRIRTLMPITTKVYVDCQSRYCYQSLTIQFKSAAVVRALTQQKLMDIVATRGWTLNRCKKHKSRKQSALHETQNIERQST